MSSQTVSIVRYPNRRFYNRQSSRYVSLGDIEDLVRSGHTVEIQDSQSNEDLTRGVLTRIIMEHHPEKMKLFPIDMLHCMLRPNDMMTEFLRDYFRQSLTYLSFLQQHGTTASSYARPTHWVKAWLDGITAGKSNRPTSETSEAAVLDTATRDELVTKIAQLEERLRLLEGQTSESNSA